MKRKKIGEIVSTFHTKAHFYRLAFVFLLKNIAGILYI
jgi:hypothetical protein